MMSAQIPSISNSIQEFFLNYSEFENETPAVREAISKHALAMIGTGGVEAMRDGVIDKGIEFLKELVKFEKAMPSDKQSSLGALPLEEQDRIFQSFKHAMIALRQAILDSQRSIQ